MSHDELKTLASKWRGGESKQHEKIKDKLIRYTDPSVEEKYEWKRSNSDIYSQALVIGSVRIFLFTVGVWGYVCVYEST